MGVAVPADRLIGYRMRADQSFADRVHASAFTTAEWELLMSVVSFEIDDPSDPDSAELVPELSDIDDALAATDELPDAAPYQSGTPGGPAGGFLGALRDRFGLDDRGAVDRREEAAALIREYTAFLEGLIRDDGAWSSLCEAVESEA